MKKDEKKSVEKSPKKEMKYIGPDYRNGIIDANNNLHRPAHVPKDKIPAYLEQYPEMKKYFEMK